MKPFAAQHPARSAKHRFDAKLALANTNVNAL
jgi:hypothetical protein